MSFNVILGAGLIGFGCISLYATFAKPHWFKKREAMKKFWGDKVGKAVHFGGYVVLPIVAGSLILLNAVL